MHTAKFWRLDWRGRIKTKPKVRKEKKSPITPPLLHFVTFAKNSENLIRHLRVGQRIVVTDVS